ncbi:hypothetical protein FM106_08215 [Brachybacterium faecium]|nr:hypothetical protein FM106_08215 [Brachybacterium faecium]
MHAVRHIVLFRRGRLHSIIPHCSLDFKHGFGGHRPLAAPPILPRRPP